MEVDDVLAALDDRAQVSAAVAGYFEPAKLLGTKSLVDDERHELIDGLARICEPVDVDGHRYWTVTKDVRRAALQGLQGRPDLQRLLGQVDLEQGDSFGRYLLRGLRNEDLTREIGASSDLDDLLRAARFVGYGATPAAEDGSGSVSSTAERDIRRHISRNEAENSLLTVIPHQFIGRAGEYRRLLAYRRAEVPTGQPKIPVLLVTGPGGVGKSALVSRFVHRQRRWRGSAPVIHLDFDRVELLMAHQLELTFELTRQIGHFDDSLDLSLSQFRDRARSVRSTTADSSFSESSGTAIEALYDLANLLQPWKYKNRAVTIVLDTFEEVAIRGYTAVDDVLSWTYQLRDVVGLSQLHVIVSGREVRPDAPHLSPADLAQLYDVDQEITLSDLSPAAGRQLLEALGAPTVLARRLVPIFGANPLVLKLLSQFIKANDTAEVHELIEEGEKTRAGSPGAEIGVRFLYGRILSRVRDTEVAKLANPGLLLRRVTSQLIEQVLAGPCHLELGPDRSAVSLLHNLAAHVWLVRRSGPDEVMHRADTRRLMLPGLEDDPKVDSAAIHRAAAAYYESAPVEVAPDVAELEAVYHRGFLRQLPAGLDEPRARQLVQRLGPDLEFWPIPIKATLKATAGLHAELSEEELKSLSGTAATTSRASRVEQRLLKGDVIAAEYEKGWIEVDQPVVVDSPSRPGHEAAIWQLALAKGDLDFLTDPDRVRRAVEEYFERGQADVRSSAANLTNDIPWLAAVSVLMSGRQPQPVFTERATERAVGSATILSRLYALACANLAGDEAAARALVAGLADTATAPLAMLSSVDQIAVVQAAGAGKADISFPGSAVLTIQSAALLRYPSLIRAAELVDDGTLAELMTESESSFARARPSVSQVTDLRNQLGNVPLRFAGVHELRMVATKLSFLYTPIAQRLAELPVPSRVEMVDELADKTNFWPSELTGDSVAVTAGTTQARVLSTVIETADRAGLLAELVAELANRRADPLPSWLTSGLRDLERLLSRRAVSITYRTHRFTIS